MQALVGRSTPVLRVPTRTACGVQMHSLIQYLRRHIPGTSAVQTRAAKSGHKLDQDRLMPKQHGRVRLAVVGDVHGQWTPADAAALRLLAADAVLWVGDIANEDLGLVQQIAALDDLQKAVVLGNHDAWYSMTARGRQRTGHTSPTHSSSGSPTSAAAAAAAAAQPQQQVAADKVQQQLDALGADHVGYGHKVLPGTNISIVGARPFSKGGKDWDSMAEFMSRFGVADMQQSADKVLQVIREQVPAGNVLLLLAHNGPEGLGSEPYSICGVDWKPEAGDWGDPDLAAVLQQLREQGMRVDLVLHGHMHHMIKGGARRQMVHIDPGTGTVHLNAATVPRVVTLPHSNGPAAASRHHFLLVELQQGVPSCAADVWVQATQHTPNTPGSSSSGDTNTAVAAQQRNFLASSAAALHAVQHSKSKSKSLKQAAAKANHEEALRRAQLQAPQQMQLRQGGEPQLIDGYQVHVAEVYEVLRVLQPHASAASGAAAAAAAEGGGVGSGSTESQSQAVLPGWQYFDAHKGRWVCIQPSAALNSSAAAAVSSQGVSW